MSISEPLERLVAAIVKLRAGNGCSMQYKLQCPVKIDEPDEATWYTVLRLCLNA